MNVRNERQEAKKMVEPGERGRRLILLAKNWKSAVNNIFKWWEDDMSRVSFDESTEPLMGR
jgi:hypothetical protein